MVQSNESTIQQMNVAIATFEGRKFYGHTIDKFGGDTHNALPVMKYHTSWDWLMQAWDKLRTSLYACMPASGINDGFDKYSDAWKTSCFNAEIKTAHNVVYQAIQWLNQQKQTNGSSSES